MGDLVDGMPCRSLWETRSVFQGAVGACVHDAGSFHRARGPRSASRLDPETMVVGRPDHWARRRQRDADQDYPESDSETSWVRVWPDGAALTLRLEVEIYPHRRNGPRCGGCGRRGPPTTRWTRGGSSSCRSGACASSSCIACAGSPARPAAGCASSGCRGRRGSTPGFWQRPGATTRRPFLDQLGTACTLGGGHGRRFWGNRHQFNRRRRTWEP